METTAGFIAYGHALASLALSALVALLLSAYAGAAKAGAGLQPGQEPPPDYSNRIYRIHRASANADAFIGVFAASVAAAALAGADPFWTNLLASIAFLSRLAHPVFHIAGIGAANMGPRSFAFLAGWACCAVLAAMAAVAAVTA